MRDLASASYEPSNMAAAVSSGSFLTEGMVVIPCTMRSVAAIAHGMGELLVHRAADNVKGKPHARAHHRPSDNWTC